MVGFVLRLHLTFLSKEDAQDSEFCSFFWENWGHHKLLSRFTDLYKWSNTFFLSHILSFMYCKFHVIRFARVITHRALKIYPFSPNYLPYSGKRIILIITRHFLFIWTFIDYMPVQKISREIAYVSFIQSKKNVQLYLPICNLHLNKIFLGFTDPSHLRFGVPFFFKF